MTVYVERTGAGPGLVLVHGWGMHGGVWDTVVGGLAQHFRVSRVDLPGHGRSGNIDGPYTLEGLAEVLAAAVDGPAMWLGWSLGGMALLELAARYPALVQRLVLVACTPRFVRKDDWPEALEANVLEGFAQELERDYRATLSRFIALQARGGERARDDVRRLRATLFEHGEPHPEALRGGLAILQKADLRVRLAAVSCPTLLIGGANDTLVPATAIEKTAQLLPDARVVLIPGAGHAPFLSHGVEFMQRVLRFADE